MNIISERKKLILWLLIEEYFDIKPRECGVVERDRIEVFLSKVGEVFDADKDVVEVQLQNLRNTINDLDCQISELESGIDNF